MTHSEEINRIRAEYRRRASEIPQDYYSPQHPGNKFIHSSRKSALIKILKQKNIYPLMHQKILEIGCGRGDWLLDFKSWGIEGKNLFGIDLDSVRLREAKERLPQAELKMGNASSLPWPSDTFDIILQSTVFTSVLDAGLKKEIALEMQRVLKPSGIILWYDFFVNNPYNPHVRGIKADEIKHLFKGCEVQLNRVTLAPPLTRWLAPKSWKLGLFLEGLKILNTHYLAVIKKI